MIVGVAGLAGSGKDTMGSILASNYGFSIVKFAKGLRSALYALNPYVSSTGPLRYREAVDLSGYDVAKQLYPEIRRLSQTFGTEVGREIFGPDIWVELTRADIIETGGDIVVTDVRFANEFNMIQDMGGVNVLVTRPGVTAMEHVSENSLQGVTFDFVLENDGTVSDFEDTVDDWYDVYRVAELLGPVVEGYCD